MTRLTITDLQVESFATATVETNALNTPSYTEVGTCCTGGPDCACGGGVGTQE